jgi:hypothetical protein
MIRRAFAGKDTQQRTAQTIRQQLAIVFNDGFDREVRRRCGTLKAATRALAAVVGAPRRRAAKAELAT